MKILYKIFIAIFCVTLIFSLIGSLYYINKINTIYEDDVIYVFDDNYQYHLSLIIPESEDTYWRDFKEGAYEAAKANNCALEMHIVESSGDENSVVCQYLDIAEKSKLDGVIVIGEKTESQDEAINSLHDKEINVVVVGRGNAGGSVSTYVGTNYDEYGIEAAKLISQIEISEGHINLAVILSSQLISDRISSASQSDIMINGIRSITERTYNMSFITTKIGSSDLLGVEDVTRDILSEHPDVNVIFCTNPIDTETAARVVIEQNLVGKVHIVGTGVTDDIISYIEKGIVYGSIDRNGYQAGYKSVELICSSDEAYMQTDYIDIDIDIYTKLNIDMYDE